MLPRQTENNCLPAPITSAILRRVLCELPIGTSRAVESCINSYKKRFMSSQDILEFLKSIARQSDTLRNVFKEHDRQNGAESPAWEQAAASSSPANIVTPSIREPAGPPTGLSTESPSALLHGPIPSVTDATAWSVPDGGSGVPLELLWQQEQEYAKWAGQPLRTFSQPAAPSPRTNTMEPRLNTLNTLNNEFSSPLPQRSPRTLQRSGSPPRSTLPRSSSPPRSTLARSGSPPRSTLPRSGSPPRRSAALATGEPAGASTEPRGRASAPREPRMSPREAHVSPQPRMSPREPRMSHPLGEPAAGAVSVPFELLWEQDQWAQAPVPSPEDLISGRRGSNAGQEHRQHDLGDHSHAGPAEEAQLDSMSVPFELLWEVEQYQNATYRPPVHVGHEPVEPRVHEPPGLQPVESTRHAPPPAGVPFELLWQQQDVPATPVPTPEDLISPQDKEPAADAHPLLPLELLWQTDEWQHTGYPHLDPAPIRVPARKPALKAAPEHKVDSRQAPAPQGVPFHLMFEQQGPMRAADSALAQPAPAKSRRAASQMDDGMSGMLLGARQAQPPSWVPGGGAGGEQEEAMSESSESEGEGAVKEEATEAAAEGEAKPKPKRRRIRTVKPSAPPTEEEKEQMARYAARRKDEVERRRREAGRAALRVPVMPPARKGKKKGADKEGPKWEPVPAGSEDKPMALLRFTLMELAKHLDRSGKASLQRSLAAYNEGAKDPQELAADIQELVDARQLIIPLPLPMPRAPFRLGGMPPVMGKFGPPGMHGRAPFLPPPFPGMPGFHPGMMPMGMHFPPGMDMSMLMPKQGKAAGGGRRRKRKRGADRDASARCPVCVDCPLHDDRWVKCDGCSTWYHQVCVLYNELANGRKLRFFCRTPQCQKRNSRQLNRRYRKARHPTSPMLPDTLLSADLSTRTAGVCRTDRKVVVKEVLTMPMEECMAGEASAKDTDGKCSCCTRRTLAGLQHTVTGSDLLFMLIFVDEHTPKTGPKRLVVQELAVSGMYEEATEGEGVRVETAMLAGYLVDAAKRGFEKVELAEVAASGDKSGLISNLEPVECARRAEQVWARAMELGKEEGAVLEHGGHAAKLRGEDRKEEAEAPAKTSNLKDCQIMESGAKLRAFLASRQYGFSTLQMAKYASMMLVYHLDQAMTATATSASGQANRDGEEEGDEEEMEDAGEPAGNVDGGSDEDMEGGVDTCTGFEAMAHAFQGADAWRKDGGAGACRGPGGDSNMLYSQPYMFPFLDAHDEN